MEGESGLRRAFGKGGNDMILLDETNGALPAAQLYRAEKGRVVAAAASDQVLPYGKDASADWSAASS
jgi:hypothetical protein